MSNLEMRYTKKGPYTQIDLLDGETSISHLKVWDLTMRIDHVTMRCGGIGAVGTEAEHRQQGHSRRVIEYSLAWMAEQGYQLSALFGIPDYYPKYGFAVALIDSEITVATRDLESAPKRYTARNMTPEDAPAVLSLYTLNRGSHSGSVVRDPATWNRFRLGANWTDRVGAFVLTEGDEIVGYASYNLDYWRFAIGEVGYRDASVFDSLLAEIGHRAAQQRVEQVRITTPLDDPFAVHCRRYGCEVKTTYPRHSNGMVRMVNQDATLAIVHPVLAERLAASQLDWSGILTLETELGRSALALGDGSGAITVALPHTLLMQWLTGYRGVAEGLTSIEQAPAPETVALLQALFPTGQPHLWLTDRF